jgi:hypothetical protein
LAGAVAELTVLQAQYAAWLEALPSSLQESTTAEALEAICDLELADLQAIEPPRGFGRDCDDVHISTGTAWLPS